jgi:DNA-binding MarR family transcriptional regulator
MTAITENYMAIARTVDRRLFFVLDRTYLQLAQAADRALAEGSGLGRAQAAVLVYLGYHDGCTLTELSEGTGRRNAAITGLVDRMEAAELITRKQSYGDRRQRTVHLTDKGWSMREEVMADFRDFNTRLTRGLNETETAAVMKFLSQSVDNVRRPAAQSKRK